MALKCELDTQNSWILQGDSKSEWAYAVQPKHFGQEAIQTLQAETVVLLSGTFLSLHHHPGSHMPLVELSPRLFNIPRSGITFLPLRFYDLVGDPSEAPKLSQVGVDPNARTTASETQSHLELMERRADDAGEVDGAGLIEGTPPTPVHAEEVEPTDPPSENAMDRIASASMENSPPIITADTLSFTTPEESRLPTDLPSDGDTSFGDDEEEDTDPETDTEAVARELISDGENGATEDWCSDVSNPFNAPVYRKRASEADIGLYFHVPRCKRFRSDAFQ